MSNPYLPFEATIVERIQETPTIFTLRLKFCKESVCDFQFKPGQFNMLYLFGVGEVPISIVSDPEDQSCFDHTIRAVGRVTKAMSNLTAGDKVGVRGPYGRGWPLEQSIGKDIVLITGGLGCAPVSSVIRYIAKRRDQFKHLVIMQGVKHRDDLIWQDQYDEWRKMDNTQVLLAASQDKSTDWPWYSGHVTSLMDQVTFDPLNTVAMMCGPEAMMHAAIAPLTKRGLSEGNIWLSMERNMQCAVGHCGHCQYGSKFICKDGPVFPFTEVKSLFGLKGF